MKSQKHRDFVRSLSYLARSLQTVFDAHLKGMGLTEARGRVLFFLSDRPEGATQSDVTEFLQVENPTAVRILDGLEELGYVVRCPSPHDRRVKIIMLTDMGRPLADKVVKATRKLIDELMEDIDPQEVAAATALISRISRNVENLGRSPVSDKELSL